MTDTGSGKDPAKRGRRIKLRTELTEGEPEAVDKHWRGLFLDILAETSNVSEAARRTIINPSRAYKNRREDPVFAAQWHAALMEGYEHLEMETLQRLRAGTAADGPKFDTANALRLLAMHKETVAKERAKHSSLSEAEVLASINAKIAIIRARENAAANDKRAAASNTAQTSGVN